MTACAPRCRTRSFEFPARKVTVNLAPADLRKESGRFDLPIALGILAATGQIPSDQLSQYEFAGELALTGDLRPVRGALAMARSAQGDGHAFVLPAASAGEAALVRDATIFGAPSLLAVCAHLAGSAPLTPGASGHCRSRSRQDPISPTCAGRRKRSACSKSRPPARIRCC